MILLSRAHGEFVTGTKHQEPSEAIPKEQTRSPVLPTEHLDVVERRVVLQGSQLLQAQLLAASVKAIRAVDADAVVIATGPILHGAQAWGTLWAEQRLCFNGGRRGRDSLISRTKTSK